jgi:maintenance of morphology protein 1
VEDELTPGTRGQRLQALVDVDLSDDNLTLAVETSLILNYPKPMSAILPVALAVSVIRFSGTLSVSFVPTPPENAPSVSEASSAGRPKTNLAFSFLPDYRLDLSVRSLIGSRSRLQDVPKIAQLVEARVQAWFEERVVEPRVQVVGLPGLWPRMGKTRVRDGSDEDKRPQQEVGTLMPEAQPPPRRVSDHFPSQQETEALFQGLRFRSGGTGREQEEQTFTREEDMRIPGALLA